MSKVLAATCNATGVVTAESVVVPDAVVLSEGKQASSGTLLMDEDKAWYMASSATDIKTTLEKNIAALDDLTSVLTTIANTLTAIGTGMTGPTTAPPAALATGVVEILAKVTTLATTKTAMNTLKGALK